MCNPTLSHRSLDHGVLFLCTLRQLHISKIFFPGEPHVGRRSRAYPAFNAQGAFADISKFRLCLCTGGSRWRNSLSEGDY